MYVVIIVAFATFAILSIRSRLESEAAMAARAIEQMDFYNRMRRRLVEQYFASRGRIERPFNNVRGSHPWAQKLYEDLHTTLEVQRIMEIDDADVAPIKMQLSHVEQNAAAVRRHYRMALTSYNETIAKFPSSILAPLLGFEALPNLTTLTIVADDLSHQHSGKSVRRSA